jgi:hypothetical protein
MLLRTMPEPSTTEGRRIQGELKNLLEGAAVREAKSSASRRQGYPSEPHVATSRFMREASVCPECTRNTAPAAPGRLGNEHHHRDRRAHLDERVRRGTRSAGLQPSHTTGAVPDPVPTPDYYHKVLGGDETGLWLADYRLACQLGGTDDDNLIIRNLPMFLSDTARAWLEHLPPGQISNRDDLVQAFAGNFQGTYVRPGNSWDL